MNLRIMNYENKKRPTEVDFDHLDKVQSMAITVLSGDEVLTVLYKDGRCKSYDSSDDRVTDFYDGAYILYAPEIMVNRIPQFMKRKTSYDMLRKRKENA